MSTPPVRTLRTALLQAATALLLAAPALAQMNGIDAARLELGTVTHFYGIFGRSTAGTTCSGGPWT